MTSRFYLVAGLVAVMGIRVAAAEKTGQSQGTRPPTIEHDPVVLAVEGQPLTLIAHVRSPGSPIQSVTIYYTQSLDAAPLKISMEAAGAGVHRGTIPAAFIAKNRTIHYYIEAINKDEEWIETSWQSVEVKNPGEAARAGVTPAAPAIEQGGGRNWKTLALIGGAGVAVVGGAIWAANESGGGGGGGGGSSGDLTGAYAGQSVLLIQPEGGEQAILQRNDILASVEADSSVSIQNLLAAQPAVATRLNGDQLLFSVPAEQADPTHEGNIIYRGTVRDGVLSGTISGGASTPEGAVTYSGTLQASRIEGADNAM